MLKLGRTIRVRGELCGSVDLNLEGTFDGRISVPGHRVKIHPDARVTADIEARTVVVLGSVVGDISAEDRVEIAASGSVEGQVSAPRITLADGAGFSGRMNKTPSALSSASAPPAA